MKNTVTFLGAIIFASVILTGCGQNSNKQKELELKERELALKEKELQLQQNYNHSKGDSTEIKSGQINGKTDFVVQVNVQSLKGRMEPDKNADNIVFLLEKGIVLDMVDETTSMDGETWYKVKYATKHGWIFAKYAKKTRKSESPNS